MDTADVVASILARVRKQQRDSGKKNATRTSTRSRMLVADFVRRYGKWQTPQQIHEAIPNVNNFLQRWAHYLHEDEGGKTISLAIGDRQTTRARGTLLTFCQSEWSNNANDDDDKEGGVVVVPSDLTTHQQLTLNNIQTHCRRVISPRVKRGLRQFIGTVTTPLSEWDGPYIRTRLVNCMAAYHWTTDTMHNVRALIYTARTHPSNDTNTHFQSHLHAISQEFMQQYPSLWRFPVRLACRIQGIKDPLDRDHILDIVSCMAHERLCTIGRRLPERAYRSLANQLCTILHFCHRMRQHPSDTYRDNLLPTRSLQSLRDVVNLVARIAAYQQRHTNRKVASVYSEDRCPVSMLSSSSEPMEMLIQVFRSAIRAGVFEPNVPSDTTLPFRLVHSAMCTLESEDPERYSAHTIQATRTRVKTQLTEKVIAKLHAVCQTVRDQTIIELLASTGLRTGAIQGMLCTDIWDDQKEEIRPVVAVREKNSQIRYITPTATLRDKWKSYLCQEHPGRAISSLLYPSPRRPSCPPPALVRNVLITLCRRADVTHIHPHQFRSFLVGLAMERGSRLEDVSRFLGHSTPSVTYSRYWHTSRSPGDIHSLIAAGTTTMAQRSSGIIPPVSTAPCPLFTPPNQGSSLLQQIGIANDDDDEVVLLAPPHLLKTSPQPSQ